MDYMKSSDKFRLELQLRVGRMAINTKKAMEIVQLLANGAPEWIYKGEIDRLLKLVSEDNEWVYKHQLSLMLICPEAWMAIYPKVMDLRNDLKEMGY